MEILPIFKHALMISFFVFVMMLLVDFLDIATQRRVSNMMQGGVWRQYMLASFLGSTPGCLGAFMNVSLYVHGMISFGAIVGGMIATSGDEAFVMLTQFPGMALLLFGLLFICGILIFVMMYAQGMVPFSLLFTISFVQDGHGMLPMLSYSIKDSILIKGFNLVFGVALGSGLFVMGF